MIGTEKYAESASPAGIAVTVIVPAYNEAACIAETLASLRAQTLQPAEILVVDDGSTDGTGDIARRFGATVVRPVHNTGSKAAAQTFALPLVATPYVMAVDADTVLAPDAIARLGAAFERVGVVDLAAAPGARAAAAAAAVRGGALAVGGGAPPGGGGALAVGGGASAVGGGALALAVAVGDGAPAIGAGAPTDGADDAGLPDLPCVAAACGFVLPRHVRSVWERGRYIEYLFAFSFYKQVQDYYHRPLISSGCFSLYDTAALRAAGGWSDRTLAEDMDLTWSFYQAGHGVRFVPEAVCYPIEPHDLATLSKQLKRWSHGYVQNVRLHWRGIAAVPFLRSAVAVATWDALFASAVYLLLVPLLALVLHNPWLLLGYVIDAPAILVPVLGAAARRGEVGRALASMPAFLVLRPVNAIFFLRAAFTEWVLGRRFMTYEKGH